MKDELEALILKQICQYRTYNKSFEEIISNLENKFNEFNPVENSFSIETYFGKDKGEEKAKELLVKDGKIKNDWLTKNEKGKRDFNGLYIFINNSVPFYVGISKGVISRIYQHLKIHNHYSASLAYKIGLIKYEFENGHPYKGERKHLDIKLYIEPIQEFLMQQKLALFSIENIEERYLFEIYCSMKLGTWLNDFETH